MSCRLPRSRSGAPSAPRSSSPSTRTHGRPPDGARAGPRCRSARPRPRPRARPDTRDIVGVQDAGERGLQALGAQLLGAHLQQARQLVRAADGAGRQLDLPAADLREPLRLVDQVLAAAQLVARAPDAVQLEVGGHAGEQLARRERLDEIVVGARLEAFDRALLARARGQHDHGDAHRRRVLLQRRQQPEAVEVGHHHVGQHEVGRVRERALERDGPVGRGLDGVLARQQRRDVARACRRCRRRPARAARPRPRRRADRPPRPSQRIASTRKPSACWRALTVAARRRG